jgi:hypothetical protein
MGRLSLAGRAPRLAVHLVSGCALIHIPELERMIKDLAHRTWRIAVTVGPLVAIALTLAAGMKWR